MDKKVILAVAGAGKTYHICHNIDIRKRNLIIAFTHENIRNIKNELNNAFGCIPELTTVSTFDSFVYKNFILPYEYTIAKYFNRVNFKSNGITMADPPAKTIKIANSTYVNNKDYVSKKYLNHYVAKNNQYYCKTLSELALQVKNKDTNLIKRAVSRLKLFYDNILVDEFQDFRNFNYELLIHLAKLFEKVTFVGDFYQHSVSALNNSGKPFNKNPTYDSFVDLLHNLGFEVDKTSLVRSRRCAKEVCNYVKKKLNIDIVSSEINHGNIIWADGFANEVIRNDEIVKLVYKDSEKCSFNAMNWSYSKGCTLDSVCVILTKDFENIDDSSFVTEMISPSTVNKLYVAMTRSRGDLYLIKHSTLKKLGY